MIDKKLDIYLEQSKIVEKMTSIEDDIDKYLCKRCGITRRKERKEKIDEIKGLLIDGGIINE